MSDILALTEFINESKNLLWRELSSKGSLIGKEKLSADMLSVTPIRGSSETFYRLDVAGKDDPNSMKKITGVLVLDDLCRIKREDDNVVELQSRITV